MKLTSDEEAIQEEALKFARKQKKGNRQTPYGHFAIHSRR